MSKEKWVAVNYTTGEIMQVTEPMELVKAIKVFQEHQGTKRLTGFFFLESIDKIEAQKNDK